MAIQSVVNMTDVKDQGELRKLLYKVAEEHSNRQISDRTAVERLIPLILDVHSYAGELEDRVKILEAKQRAAKPPVKKF